MVKCILNKLWIINITFPEHYKNTMFILYRQSMYFYIAKGHFQVLRKHLGGIEES